MLRVKCKLCKSVIQERLGHTIGCQCGEIRLEGVSKSVICTTDSKNFDEVDDAGNIIVKEDNALQTNTRPKKAQLLDMLDEMSNSYERMPQGGLMAPITGYDLASVLLLLSSILRAED